MIGVSSTGASSTLGLQRLELQCWSYLNVGCLQDLEFQLEQLRLLEYSSFEGSFNTGVVSIGAASTTTGVASTIGVSDWSSFDWSASTTGVSFNCNCINFSDFDWRCFNWSNFDWSLNSFYWRWFYGRCFYWSAFRWSRFGFYSFNWNLSWGSFNWR